LKELKVENVQLKLIVADKKLQIRLRSWAAKLVTGPAGRLSQGSWDLRWGPPRSV
jgi:hypothetical protein